MRRAALVIIALCFGASGARAQNWVTLDDYPPEALRHNWEGTAYFTLVVDADGRAGSCKITQSSGHDILDQATCEIMKKRARFKPATDSSGKTYASNYSSAVRWQIPR